MIWWNNKRMPILYLLFYRFLKEKARNNVFIPYSLAKQALAMKIYNIPRKYFYLILKDMEELKLLKKIGNRKNVKYEFIGKDADKLLNKYDDFLA